MYKLYRHLRRSASVARGAHGNRVNAARVAPQPVTIIASWPPAGDDRPTLDETPRHCRPRVIAGLGPATTGVLFLVSGHSARNCHCELATGRR
jgi:hypothetical protein